ncbi:MAG: hypothetical protein WA985_10000 [Erythrobacter sp.]
MNGSDLKMAKVAITIVALAFLPACDLINPPDWREGTEPIAECVERLGEWDRNLDVAAGARELYVPTYTYDITLLDLEEIQGLVTEGTDQTAGSRGRAATNETSTAIADFKTQPVDEDGAFFLGNDPAFYRVRGIAQPFERIAKEGCERQEANMRLVEIEAAAMQTGSPVDADTSEIPE